MRLYYFEGLQIKFVEHLDEFEGCLILIRKGKEGIGHPQYTARRAASAKAEELLIL